MRKSLCGLILCSLIFVSPVYALEFSVLGGLDQSTQNFSPKPSSNPQGSSGMAFGATVGQMFSRWLGLQIGAFYLPRVEVVPAAAGIPHAIQYTFPNVAVPLTLEIRPFSFLSLHVGGYYAYGMGNISVTDMVTNVSVPFTYEFLTTGRNDFGLTGGGRLNLHLFGPLSLTLDVSVFYGLTNIDTTHVSTDTYMDILGVAGLTFAL